MKKAETESKQLALEDQSLKIRDLEAEIAICERRKSEMTQLFGVTSLQEVEKKLRMIEQRKDLLRRCNAIEREIREALSIQDMGDVEAMLDAADRPALEAEQVELRASDRGSGSARTRVVYGIQQSVRRGGSRRRR